MICESKYGKFPPQAFHGIFSSALRAKTYSENISVGYRRLFSGQCKRKRGIFCSLADNSFLFVLSFIG